MENVFIRRKGKRPKALYRRDDFKESEIEETQLSGYSGKISIPPSVPITHQLLSFLKNITQELSSLGN